MLSDQRTADAFANSWNNLPAGSVYTRDQFTDWMSPLTAADVAGRQVLELGCGNGSQMLHLLDWKPASVEGVDLGDSILSACKNLADGTEENWKITRSDMTTFCGPGYDLVYSIGVLHHLDSPRDGFDAVIRNVKPGGRFHCWVYAEEGNGLIIRLVDPLRKITSHLPWWLTKYGVATPLAVPFFIYAKTIATLAGVGGVEKLPLYQYCRWISNRDFRFFRHVAFDQLVTPQTVYLNRATIEAWLANHPDIDQHSTYIIMRNGNSWKFGGKRKEA